MPADKRWKHHCVGWGSKKACLPQKYPPGLATGIHHTLHTIHPSSIPTHINFIHIHTPQNVHTMYPSPTSHHILHTFALPTYTPHFTNIHSPHYILYIYIHTIHTSFIYILHMCITTHHIYSTDITQTLHTYTPSSHIIHTHTHMYAIKM